MHRRFGRNRRAVRYRRNRGKGFAFLVFVLVTGFFFWAVIHFFSILLSKVQSENISTELTIEQGQAEFQLSGEKTLWTPAFSGQTFVDGDWVQTKKNSYVKLAFAQENYLFLNQNTNLKIQTLKKSENNDQSGSFYLKTGSVWGRINPSNQNQTSKIQIITSRLALNLEGTIFNIETSENQDIVRLIKGKASIDILNAAGEVSKTVNIGVGQQLVLSVQNRDLILEGEDFLTLIDNDFIQSAWHIKNLELFDKETAGKLKQAQQNTAISSKSIIPSSVREGAAVPGQDRTSFESLIEGGAQNTSLLPIGSIGSPTIIYPQDGKKLKSNENILSIEGRAPDGAYQIQVNGYTLAKFQPGDKNWNYFAATKFGTLKPGNNIYKVVAIGNNGEQSEPAVVNVFYEDQNTTLSAPKINIPELFKKNPKATYQTSSSTVTIRGEVVNGTREVTVNGSKLRNFNLGDTEFSYIANTGFGTLKRGSNTYNIVAKGPNDTQGETRLKIFYTPVDL